jgi:hypothetical protein
METKRRFYFMFDMLPSFERLFLLPTSRHTLPSAALLTTQTMEEGEPEKGESQPEGQ